ncbi:PH domain-containing protein [Rheinheimera sp.]|uniref:PH domain-containing protein n=1 Tax=Rheinheimera sp. TaxID=1869214 RepID=UPI004048B859
MTNNAWQRVPPLSILYQSWLFSVALLKDMSTTVWVWISLFVVFKNIWLVVAIMLGGVWSIGLVVSSARWFFYRYRFVEDALEIHQGVFARVNEKIPYSRVINVEVNRPWVYRFGGYVQAVFDSAGTAGKDGVIHCIKEETVDAIKSNLVLQPMTDEQDVDECSGDRERKQIITRGARDLFIYGFAHNRIFLFLGLMIGLYYKVKEVVKDIDNQAIVFYQAIFDDMPAFAVAAVALGLLLGLSATLSGVIQMVTGYRYTLWRDGQKLMQSQGLFTRRESHITLEKLQRIIIRRTLLDRLTGRCGMELVQLNSQMTVPALRMNEVKQVCEQLGTDIPDIAFSRVSKYWFVKTVLWACPVLLFLSYQAVVTDNMDFAAWFLFAAVFIPLFSFSRWYRFGFVDDDKANKLVVRTGRLDERTFIVDKLKCQAVTINQSMIEKLLGVASVRVHFVGKTLVLSGVDVPIVQSVRQSCLREIEVSKRWF